MPKGKQHQSTEEDTQKQNGRVVHILLAIIVTLTLRWFENKRID